MRAGERVGFDIDHHDVLAGLDGLKRMGDAGDWVAGGLDDNVDALVLTGIAPAFGETRARDARGIPADVAAGRLGALRIEIGNDRHFEAGDRGNLRQKHRAEFAGAD